MASTPEVAEGKGTAERHDDRFTEGLIAGVVVASMPVSRPMTAFNFVKDMVFAGAAAIAGIFAYRGLKSLFIGGGTSGKEADAGPERDQASGAQAVVVLEAPAPSLKKDCVPCRMSKPWAVQEQEAREQAAEAERNNGM